MNSETRNAARAHCRLGKRGSLRGIAWEVEGDPEIQRNFPKPCRGIGRLDGTDRSAAIIVIIMASTTIAVGRKVRSRVCDHYHRRRPFVIWKYPTRSKMGPVTKWLKERMVNKKRNKIPCYNGTIVESPFILSGFRHKLCLFRITFF